jgi:hypothetical protein
MTQTPASQKINEETMVCPALSSDLYLAAREIGSMCFLGPTLIHPKINGETCDDFLLRDDSYAGALIMEHDNSDFFTVATSTDVRVASILTVEGGAFWREFHNDENLLKAKI